jgi:hypothetical protein
MTVFVARVVTILVDLDIYPFVKGDVHWIAGTRLITDIIPDNWDLPLTDLVGVFPN